MARSQIVKAERVGVVVKKEEVEKNLQPSQTHEKKKQPLGDGWLQSFDNIIAPFAFAGQIMRQPPCLALSPGGMKRTEQIQRDTV